ncbi:Hpt domain-containing protein [Notoacmeibacter ruber]|uniref:HPt domain-containing protein n=1 Tax=Notoacmeibacter ruber TaxID=2670375 RepID=A0A3L7JCD6_9HYPH|nr:Hpt domain-containing protein [Notoacmeibacter ruber]RLQ87221.1 hypothetical protein D8780_02340 [Notoacmeibacter ruber]
MNAGGFDQEAFDELLEIFPADRIEMFVSNLRQLSSELQQCDVAAVDVIEARAHKLVSRAGILGCSRLSELAMALETACREGQDVAGPLSAVSDEAKAVEGRFASLMASAAQHSPG